MENLQTKLILNKYICYNSGDESSVFLLNIDPQGTAEFQQVVLHEQCGWADYINIYKDEYNRLTDESPEGKAKRLRSYVDSKGNPQAYFETISDYISEYCDHHNMLTTENNCAFGDTPYEALRNYLVMKLENKETLPELYFRKDDRFIYLSELVFTDWESCYGYDVFCFHWSYVYSKAPTMELLFEGR